MKQNMAHRPSFIRELATAICASENCEGTPPARCAGRLTPHASVEVATNTWILHCVKSSSHSVRSSGARPACKVSHRGIQ
jgi:hypothetical protein